MEKDNKLIQETKGTENEKTTQETKRTENEETTQEAKKTKKEETTQEKKTLVQQCEEFQKSVKKAGVVILYTIIVICLCISCMYQYCIQQFGDGPINYSEEAFDKMKLALEGSQSQQEAEEADKEAENATTGAENKESQETGEAEEKAENATIRAEDKESHGTANFDENGEIVKPCLIADVGLDIKRFRPYVTDYNLHTEGETTILEAWKTEGTFTAKITVKIDDNYRVIETVRNYNDKAQYMKEFYNKLHRYSIIYGTIAFAVITLPIVIIFKLMIGIMKWCSNRKKRKEENQIENAGAEVPV